MGLIATRELDMYGDQSDLALLINDIQDAVNSLHWSAYFGSSTTASGRKQSHMKSATGQERTFADWQLRADGKFIIIGSSIWTASSS